MPWAVVPERDQCCLKLVLLRSHAVRVRGAVFLCCVSDGDRRVVDGLGTVAHPRLGQPVGELGGKRSDWDAIGIGFPGAAHPEELNRRA